MVAASANVVRVIVRRPHAYLFKKDHPDAPIPGFVFLDAEGRSVATVAPEDGAAGLARQMLAGAADGTTEPPAEPKPEERQR